MTNFRQNATPIFDADQADMDLGSLLKESLALVAEGKAAKDAAKRLSAGVSQSKLEKAEDAARIAQWEVAHVWEQLANVAVFNRQFCDCGRVHEQFSGLFVREKHREMQRAKRWRRVEASEADLPNEVAVRDENVALCTHCMAARGWVYEDLYSLDAAQAHDDGTATRTYRLTESETENEGEPNAEEEANRSTSRQAHHAPPESGGESGIGIVVGAGTKGPVRELAGADDGALGKLVAESLRESSALCRGEAA